MWTKVLPNGNDEQQILDLYKEHVKLRSGGHLNINTTEALTAIDVNSGKMNKEIGIEETAYRVNMEASPKILLFLLHHTLCLLLLPRMLFGYCSSIVNVTSILALPAGRLGIFCSSNSANDLLSFANSRSPCTTCILNAV